MRLKPVLNHIDIRISTTITTQIVISSQISFCDEFGLFMVYFVVNSHILFCLFHQRMFPQLKMYAKQLFFLFKLINI